MRQPAQGQQGFEIPCPVSGTAQVAQPCKLGFVPSALMVIITYSTNNPYRTGYCP